MDNAKKPYFTCALWPGIVLGLLSVIPIVNYGNLICCLWIIGGGFLAALVFKQEMGKLGIERITVGEGAFTGFIAGMIGAVIQGIGTGILWLFFHENYLAKLHNIFSVAEFDPSMQDAIAGMISNPWFVVFGSLLGAALLNAIFATFGGLLGAAILCRRRKPSSQEGS